MAAVRAGPGRGPGRPRPRQPSGASSSRAYGGNRNRWLPGQDPAVAELGHRPLRRPARRRAAAAAAGPRPWPSSTRRTSAGRGSTSGRRAPATASSRDAPARRGARRRPPSASIATKNASRGSVLADPAVRMRSAVSAPRTNSAMAVSTASGVVLDVDDVEDLRAEALRPWPGRWPRTARARSPRTDSLTTTPTRRGTNGGDPHDRLRCRTRRSARRPRRSPASTTCGATLTLATRSPFSTTWPSNTVKTSSGSSRLSRSSSATCTLTTPAAAATRSSRLWFGPRTSRFGPGDGLRQADRGVVLVQLAGLGHDDRDRRSQVGRGRAPAGRPRDSRRPLTSAAPPTVRSRVRTPPASLAGHAPTRSDPLDAHAGPPARQAASGRARPRSRGGCRPPPCALDSRGPRGCPR